MSPDEIRARYLRIREEVGPGVTVVAATKYVSVEDLGALAEARVDRFDVCTACNPKLFFSHRRTGKPRGVQGVLGVIG